MALLFNHTQDGRLDAGPGGHAANLKPCLGYISLVFLGMMRGGPASNVLDKAVQEPDPYWTRNLVAVCYFSIVHCCGVKQLFKADNAYSEHINISSDC